VLWRGVNANVARAMLMTAAQLATYDIFKGMLLSTPYGGRGQPMKEAGGASNLMPGGIAAALLAATQVLQG